MPESSQRVRADNPTAPTPVAMPHRRLPGDGRPAPEGLYNPAHEHDACGVGFVVDMHGRKSHEMVQRGLQCLYNLDHRGATGAEANVRAHV